MLLNYIKIAWKVLLRHPFYTFITLFGISLTLTVLVVLTSFVDHLVGAHYPETNRTRSLYIERIVQMDSSRSSTSSGPMSFKFLMEYAKTLKTPERVSIYSSMSKSNAYVGSQKIKLDIKFTDADFWEVMAFDFLEGKPYNQQNIANGDFVAVITDGFKKQYFDNSSESAVGKTVEIENITYKVIGVVKGSPITRLFSYADVYFPYTAPKSNYQNAGLRGDYEAVLLAKTPDDLNLVRTEFQDRVKRIPVPGVQDGFKYAVVEIKSEPFAAYFITTIMSGGPGLKTIFFGVIAFVLLMLLGLPAINLVNLNVSRILERGSEIGIRKAFGAPVRTLLWQFIVENIFITFIGGAIALVLSFIIIQLINNSGLIAYADLTINGTVLAVSLLICLIFGLLSGVLPALRMSKLSIADALKS
ncbi:ABC transporter permease [Spirosoma flavum]|uniref:ABC transporter permease n=1 Tax=Spirosoma flavum TaxID=2048557 RepID=A0ABW6AJQ0_9BACT